ncbi:MAG: hypothetical protein JXR40_08860 [Pontiellaceae bacterium]|nr:hypothetical protein [Pontiellaceae bacterium]
MAYKWRHRRSQRRCFTQLDCYKPAIRVNGRHFTDPAWLVTFPIGHSTLCVVVSASLRQVARPTTETKQETVFPLYGDIDWIDQLFVQPFPILFPVTLNNFILFFFWQ